MHGVVFSVSWLVVWFGVGSVIRALGPGQRNDVGNFQVAEVAAGTFRDLFHGLVKIPHLLVQTSRREPRGRRATPLLGRNVPTFVPAGFRPVWRGWWPFEIEGHRRRRTSLGSLCFDVVGAASIPLQSPCLGTEDRTRIATRCDGIGQACKGCLSGINPMRPRWPPSR